MGDTEPWEESVVVHGGLRTSQPLPLLTSPEQASGPMQSLLLPGPTLFRSKAMEETLSLEKPLTTPSHGLC